MGQAVKRRQVVSIRANRNVVRKLKPVKKYRIEGKQVNSSWIDEIATVLLVLFATFILISFCSFKFSISNTEFKASENSMGPIGHLVATYLNGFFGWSSLTLVFWALILAAFLGLSSEAEITRLQKGRFKSLVGVVGTLLSVSIISAIAGGTEYGGMVGIVIAEKLKFFINSTGTILLTTPLLILFLSLALKKSLFQLISITVRALKVLSISVLVKIPLCLFGLFYKIFTKSYQIFSKFRWQWKPILTSSSQSLPKPTLRKNLVKFSDSAIGLNDIKPTHVVVNRRERLKKSKEKTFSKDTAIKKQDYLDYRLPNFSLLAEVESPNVESHNDEELKYMSQLIEEKLKDFTIDGRVTEIHPGPVVTLFEFEPAAGVKVGRISSLQDDLAMSLKAQSIRIIAPLPKKGTVGIEVPNSVREIVRLREVLQSDEFLHSKSILSVALGKDVYGDPLVVDIASMPHLLVAGATGTGKSVCINSILLSLLYRASPKELGVILIDPKILELSVYDGIPHLKVPVVTDPRQAKAVLKWAVIEMERRYRLMHHFGVRSVDAYNRIIVGDKLPLTETLTKAKVDSGVVELSVSNILEEGPLHKQSSESIGVDLENPVNEKQEPIPKTVIIIDELADLMLSVGRDVEELIARLAQKARAAGIHLIVATQRPSVDVITGLIKANFPARLSFRVSSRIDSRTILDSMGAEKLLGRGDSLYLSPGSTDLQRQHGAFVSDSEVKAVVDFIKKQSSPEYDQEIIKACQQALEEEQDRNNLGSEENFEYDALYDQALQFVTERGQASTSLLQRYFRIGYNRAARIIDMLERDGVIGPMDGAKPREVLVNSQEE